MFQRGHIPARKSEPAFDHFPLLLGEAFEPLLDVSHHVFTLKYIRRIGGLSVWEGVEQGPLRIGIYRRINGGDPLVQAKHPLDVLYRCIYLFGYLFGAGLVIQLLGEGFGCPMVYVDFLQDVDR